VIVSSKEGDAFADFAGYVTGFLPFEQLTVLKEEATLSRFDWIRSTPMRMDDFQSHGTVASLSEIQSAGQAVNEGQTP